MINSIPGLEDSPRKPLFVQELPQAAKTDQVKQAKPGANQLQIKTPASSATYPTVRKFEFPVPAKEHCLLWL